MIFGVTIIAIAKLEEQFSYMGSNKEICDKAPIIFSPTVVFTQLIDLPYKYLFKIIKSLKTSLNLID